MKYVYLSVIILIITFGSCKKDQISDIQGLIEQDKWEKVYANSILTLTGIAFANDTTCYSVGAIGCMLKTNNNGDTWTIIDSIETTSPSFTDISFFNSSIGIAVGNAGRISRTTDGGISWLTTFLPSGNSIHNICILDDQVCFVTKGSRIFKSTDSGLNWVQVYASPDPYLVFQALSFGSSDVGYGVLARTGDSMYGSIVKTKNKGSDWTTLSVDTTLIFMSSYFVTNNIGYVSDLSGNLYKTTNGGDSWFLPSKINMCGYRRLFFLTENTGYGCKLSGELVKTIDGGLNWIKVISENYSSLNAMVFNKKLNSLFVAGNEGIIYKCLKPTIK
jgi:photosystem II stability/assembly factor-like uncharacterized protein